jgi:hypothetical protein
LIQDSPEIDTQGNVVYIGKYGLFTELLAKTVVNMAGDIGSIVSAIGDEYLAGHPGSLFLFFFAL